MQDPDRGHSFDADAALPQELAQSLQDLGLPDPISDRTSAPLFR
jgi:hypothetical protein